MNGRRWARIRAWVDGYFWRRCPACSLPFGGHEWRSVDGHLDTIPAGPSGLLAGNGRAICPTCTMQGEGCAYWAAARPGAYSADCACPKAHALT